MVIIILNFSFQTLLITLFSVLTVISIHNFGHSFIAYKLGDPTSKNLGKMTINPFVHIDLFGLLAMFLFGFGWSSPTPVNRYNFKNQKRDFIIFSLGGILFNLLCALFCSYLLKIDFGVFNYSIKPMLNSLILYNISFSAFNLLPIPGLDGWDILKEFLNNKYDNLIYQVESYSLIIFVIILVTDVINIFMYPIVSILYSFINFLTFL